MGTNLEKIQFCHSPLLTGFTQFNNIKNSLLRKIIQIQINSLEEYEEFSTNMDIKNIPLQVMKYDN